MKFKIGDIVHLKSGSARQTVIEVDHMTTKITTAWVHYHTQTPHTMTAYASAFVSTTERKSDEVPY